MFQIQNILCQSKRHSTWSWVEAALSRVWSTWLNPSCLLANWTKEEKFYSRIQNQDLKIVKEVEIVKEVKRSDGLWRFACFCLILQSSTLRKFRNKFCKCCATWPFSRSACWYKRQFSQIAPLWTNWKTSMHLPLCGCKMPAGQFYITCPVGIGLGCISKWLGWIPTVTEDMVDIVLEVTEVMVATAMAMASNMFCNSSVEFHFAMP